jgi:hypothetical protein
MGAQQSDAKQHVHKFICSLISTLCFAFGPWVSTDNLSPAKTSTLCLCSVFFELVPSLSSNFFGYFFLNPDTGVS